MKKNKRKQDEINIRFSGGEIIERKVTEFGNSSHVILPKKYSGKKIKIIVGVKDE